jgi:holo-[acyl-carrier protein] synthase
MSEIRVGIDLVEVSDIRRKIQASGNSFLEASWTAHERQYCAGQHERLAARWAAKEATMKAMGIGLGDVSPLDIEVESEEGLPPKLRLHRNAASEAGRLEIHSWSLSMSHVGLLAVAVVVGAGGSDQ